MITVLKWVGAFLLLLVEIGLIVVSAFILLLLPKK